MDEKTVKEALGVDVIMNSILGKLYDILTMGEDGEPKTDDNFFSWATPGIPVVEEDFQFMTQGLVGKTKPEKLKAVIKAIVEDIKKANEGCTQEELAVKLSEVDTNKVMRDLIVQDEHDMVQQAENFSRLVDFIPDVSGTGTDGFRTYARNELEGTLSHAYYIALKYCQVLNTKIEPEVQKVIDQYKQIMIKQVEKPAEPKAEEPKEEAPAADGGLGDFAKLASMVLSSEPAASESPSSETETDTGEGLPVPSDFARLYNLKAAAYEDALLAYGNFLVDGLSSNESGAAIRASRNAEVYRNKLKRAMDEWVTIGHKNEYEKMANFIKQVEGRSISALRDQYETDYNLSQLTGLSSGAKFLYATLSPASFATSAGWTKFTFRHNELHDNKTYDHKRNMSQIKTNSNFFKLLNFKSDNQKADAHYQLDTDLKRNHLDISFEICQVPIIRPWFNVSFLNSKFWRFDETQGSPYKGTMLCDGNRPPKEGILPAYPTAIIFIRNLNLQFSDMSEINKKINDYERNKQNYSGGLSLGKWIPIDAGASYNSDDSKGTNTSKRDYEISNQGITVPGLQILGFKCHILPKSPNPNPDIKDWI